MPQTEEQARYETHQNSIDNLGYVKFLTPVVKAVTKSIESSSAGLDYGCGPGPVLAELLFRNGYKMSTWDPYFSPNEESLHKKYVFVTCTEVAEHFYRPHDELLKIKKLLVPSGSLFLLTQLLNPQINFAKWYYRLDPTHVGFFSEKTHQRLSELFGFNAVGEIGHLTHFKLMS